MGIKDVQYVYWKTRDQFGKQCTFETDGPIAIENIEPDPELRKEFISKNEIHVASQNSEQYAVHEAQTENAQLIERGMLHCEGGWPKEVNFKDEEATTRVRKRVMRSEDWAPTIMNLMTPIEHCVKQNNAINIYENYFDEMIPSNLVSPFASRVVNTYTDPDLNGGPISNISWSRGGKKMIVSHCSMEFQGPSSGLGSVSYLWAIENPVHPLVTLKPEIPSVTIEFNPRHSSLLVSGQMTGQVALWDLRTARFPKAESHRLYSHSDPASIVMWIDTKTHCEFASSSSDGLMKWWDIRKLREPTQTLAMDLDHPKVTQMLPSVGISSMNCSSATKFIVGLENGIVINGSLKTRIETEKLGTIFKCHFGPVYSVHRNPFIPKIFMTVGDWTSRIWAEDTKESCLASTEYRSKKNMLTAGCWSNSRVSVFYVIGSTGELEVWDLLSGLNKPVEMLKLGMDPLTRMKPHENGKFIAIGSRIGNVYLVESSEGLITNRKTDKAVLTAYFENCRRHERSVDNRLKEIRLAQRSKRQDSEAPPDVTSRKNDTANRKRPDKKNFDGARVGTDVNQNVNEKTSEKVENTTSVPLDFELIEPEKEYFALVREVRNAILRELKRYGNPTREKDSDKLHEHKVKGHHKSVRHNRKSYKSKEPHQKYVKAERPSETESSSPGPAASQSSEIIGEVIKPKSPSRKLTKIRKRSPNLCADQVPPRICRPEICCRDVKGSSNKGNKSTVKEWGSVNENKDSLARNTKAFFSAGEKVPDERVPHPFSTINPVLEVEGSKSTKSEKYHSARMAEVKDYSEEAKAQILRRAIARPSAILFEALQAKERIDREADRIRSRAKREPSEGTKSMVQVTEAEEKIHPKDDHALDKTEDVEPGSAPIVRSVQEAKMKEPKLSPKETKEKSCVIPRRALTALQVMPTEVFKPLPKLTEREVFFSQNESYEDRMYPGSSAFPPLPRIVLPKLLERPPDPAVIEHEELGRNVKKVKGRVKSGVNKAEKSRSPNN